MLLKLCYLYFLASEPDCSSSIHFSFPPGYCHRQYSNSFILVKV